MTAIRDQVKEFHEAFEQPIGAKPMVPADAVVRFRLRLILSEVFELLEATMDLKKGNAANLASEAARLVGLLLAESDVGISFPAKVDIVEMADALADIEYVIEGTRLAFGIDGGPIADEVHRSNMAKLVDGKSLKSAEGKVLKPEGWTPPDVAGELRKQGWVP